MALDANKTGKKIATIITDAKASAEMKVQIENLWIKIVAAIFDDLKSDMEITIPGGKVIIQVVGSATGTPNPAPIPCDVDGGA